MSDMAKFDQIDVEWMLLNFSAAIYLGVQDDEVDDVAMRIMDDLRGHFDSLEDQAIKDICKWVAYTAANYVHKGRRKSIQMQANSARVALMQRLLDLH